MSFRWKVALSLLAAHVLLLSQFMSLNRRLPKDLLALPSELVIQLVLLGLVTVFLAALFLSLGLLLSKLPHSVGSWVWPVLGSLVLGRLIRDAVSMAFPLVSYHLGVSDLLWAVAIPSLVFLLTLLVGLERANRWVSSGSALALCTLAGLWLPMLSALVTWPSRRTADPGLVQPVRRNPTVWVFIFDELDGEIAWEGSLSPKLRRELEIWQAQSFSCHRALRAGPSTQTAISALLLGRPLLGSATFSLGGIGLNLRESDGSHTRWMGADSLFHAWVAGGGQFRVLGWFYPYATWFGNFATLGVQYPAHFGRKGYHLQESFSHRFLFTVKNCFVESPYSQADASAVGRDYLISTQADLEHRIALLQRAEHPGLTWVHWPVPHPPALLSGKREGYGGNLDHVADVLEKFRLTQMATGAWDRDIVIVTGDHGLRPESYRDGFFDPLRWPGKVDGGLHVPFLCRLPGMKSGREYAAPLSMAGLRRLLLGIQAGRIQSYDDVEAWARNEAPLSAQVTRPSEPSDSLIPPTPR